MDPTTHENIDPDSDSQETLEWRHNRVSAARFVALQLRDAKEAKFDVGTPVLGVVALLVSSPVAVVLYRRGLWGGLWLLAIAAFIWSVTFVAEVIFRLKLKADRETAATALDNLAAAIQEDDGVSNG